MSSTTLFVSNFPFTTTETDLRGIFERYSTITNVRIITDRQTGRSRGYAFVELEDQGAVGRAVEELNETSYGGRRLVVNEAKGRPSENPGPLAARRRPPFRHRIVVEWHEETHAYDAQVPELGVHAAGDTPEGAMRDAIRHAGSVDEKQSDEECAPVGLTSPGI